MENSAQMEKMKLLFPLFQAAAKGDLETVKSYIQAGADVNLPSPFDERTTLHVAAGGGHLDVVKYLVQEAGAELRRDRSGTLPVHDAKQGGHCEVRSFLHSLEQDFFKREGQLLQPKQKDAVFDLAAREGVFVRTTLQQEVQHFFNGLGLHPSYFEHFTAAQIARHVQTLLAAKQAAEIKGERELQLWLEDEHCGFFLTALKGCSKHRSTVSQVSEYLNQTVDNGLPYELTFMASANSAFADGDVDARVGIYYVDRTHWESTTGVGRLSRDDVDLELREETDLQRIATANFLKTTSVENYAIHQRLVEQAVSTRSTVMELFEATAFPGGCSRGYVLVLAAYELGGKDARPLLEDLQELLWQAHLEPRRFYVASFANGASTYTLHFPDVVEASLHELQASLRYVQHTKRVPGLSHKLWTHVVEGNMTPAHFVYIRSALKFVYAFFPREKYVPQYAELQMMLHDPRSRRKLDELYMQTIQEIVTPDRVYEIMSQHMALVVPLFEDFKNIALGVVKPFWNEELAEGIDKMSTDPLSVQVLRMLLKFNQSLLITNFFRTDAAPAAFSFRLDPKIILAGRPKSLYAEVPFGIYLVVGRNFHGFHTRFREIARGGVRLVRSRDVQAYARNNASLFEEGFNLAYTQQLKNKDIPEGGAKGVILLDSARGGKHSQSIASGQDCFLKYMDALLDCMLLPGDMHSHCANEELLFFGPDEGTADCMDIGARRARDRGHRYWKGLTTGKSVQLGGVPHDVYGITTRGVRCFARELYKVLKLDEQKITKFQTGGPDGDLGSNEILQSCDVTLAIVDASGVVYDPNGLARVELERLAHARQQISNFNRTFLGEGGFMVLIAEENVVLPDGSQWRSGLEVRDAFPFTKYATADLFVPCGGRPGTINASNVSRLIGEGGSPWKMIVEGANLFITEEARSRFEDAGVHVIKDSSANKGGVTSSSLEVLASLAFPPKEHDQCLTRFDERCELPEFYLKYVDEIIGRIEENCRDEFRVIWEANTVENAGETMKKIDASKLLSKDITVLTDHIAAAELSDELVREVLPQALPTLIVERLGLDVILERLPPAYVKATIAYYLASKYVYQYGVRSNAFAFHTFMQKFKGNLVYDGRQEAQDISALPTSPRISNRVPLL